MKKTWLFLAGAVALTALIFVFGGSSGSGSLEPSQKTLQIGAVAIRVEVADTDAQRTQGLSGRQSLGEWEGMLFVFDKPDDYGFWMKDMNFAIDIVWLDENKKITHMESWVAPETYPKIFNSPYRSLYVLELPAGFLAANKVQMGDQVAF